MIEELAVGALALPLEARGQSHRNGFRACQTLLPAELR